MIPGSLAPLANHLWQSTLFAGAVWLITLALRKNRAAVRHRLWLAASVKFLIPFSLLAGIGGHFQWRTAPLTAPPPVSIVVEAISQPFAIPLTSVGATPAAQPWTLPAVLAGVWLCGFAGSIAWWFIGWRQLRRAVRRATSLNFDLPIPAMCCLERLEPGVFGIFRPVLLLPQGISDRLTPAQLQAVFAHELCHVRRRDNMAAAIHLVVEAVFWFHPLVWWIRSRLIEEQERACDEEVLRLGGDPQVYAESILKICEFYLTSPSICVSGITSSNLKQRIEDIMRNRTGLRLGFNRTALLAIAATLAFAGPIAIGVGGATVGRPQSVPAVPLSFEVASIRPSGRDADGARPGGYCSDGRCDFRRVTLEKLISIAYSPVSFGGRLGIPSNQIEQATGAELGWVKSESFDIQAKAENTATATEAQLFQMLQQLLADRFKLTIHRETREVSGYLLQVVKSGAKLKTSAGLDAERPHMGGGPPSGGAMSGNAVPVEVIATFLSARLGRPVRDETGLSGLYDWELTWAPDDNEVRMDGVPVVPRAADDFRPSLLTALQEQLGLRVESGKVAVEILIIDRAQRPTAN